MLALRNDEAKYPGLRKSFATIQRTEWWDFFDIEDQDLDTFSLLDVLMHFKVGASAMFLLVHLDRFVERTENAETFQEVLQMCWCLWVLQAAT